MKDFIRIHEQDNVAVTLKPIPAGAVFLGITAAEDIPRGHKMALQIIPAGEMVVKYGMPIGHATKEIAPGSWVHTHNMDTNRAWEAEYAYNPKAEYPAPRKTETFKGYPRLDGRVGVRNEIWIIPTAGSVSGVARVLSVIGQEMLNKTGVEGLYAFPHSFGCSQTGLNRERTSKVLAGLVRHPNAAAVLVVGLDSEDQTHAQFLTNLGDYDPDRVKFLTCRQAEDELVEGRKRLRELADYANQFHRQEQPLSELVIGMMCGSPDGLSSVVGNSVLGRFSDMFTAMGGATVLTEVPEMFGAEHALLDRCADEAVFQKAAGMFRRYQDYLRRYDEPVYRVPSPEEQESGITTLEDKACGYVQKSGSAPVADVLGYGDPVTQKGLNLLYGPSDDLTAAAGLTAAGAHLILYSSGCGTPFGAPAPTLKLATNSQMAEKKMIWTDFNAGMVSDGARTIPQTAEDLVQMVRWVASGHKTRNEERDFREISIFQDGVVL